VLPRDRGSAEAALDPLVMQFLGHFAWTCADVK
jgi:hypothetical protein